MSRCVLWPTRLRTRRTKLAARAGQLEADQVGTEQPLEDLAAPRQLGEQLGRRERDVEVEADAQVGPLLAQHLRHQLELVVLHPDGGALGGDLGGPVGEALVDRDVGVPPLAVELRLGDDVVVERPEGAVGEALVELLDLPARSACTGTAESPSSTNGSNSSSSAEPGQPIQAPSLARITGSRAVTRPPGERRHVDGAVGQGHPVHGQSVGHDHEVCLRVSGHASTLATPERAPRGVSRAIAHPAVVCPDDSPRGE